MQAIIERCCGLEVHQETVVACLLVGAPGAQTDQGGADVSHRDGDLEALGDRLRAAAATHVGMESTGVYWRPVYAVLEGHFELIVGNARHIRNVPGRKTDMKDSEWIADLVRHSLIAKSFVPPRPLRELRELLRCRRELVESQAAERNRLLKLLETANIKLASVASDVFGVSGRTMLRALIEGEASAEAMADLAKGQLRRTTNWSEARDATTITAPLARILAAMISSGVTGITRRCSTVACSRSRMSAAPVRIIERIEMLLITSITEVNHIECRFGLNLMRTSRSTGSIAPPESLWR